MKYIRLKNCLLLIVIILILFGVLFVMLKRNYICNKREIIGDEGQRNFFNNANLKEKILYNTNASNDRRDENASNFSEMINVNSIINNKSTNKGREERHWQIQRATIWQPLDFIPAISELKLVENRPYIRADIVQPFIELPKVSYSENVAILTILRDSARFLDQYKRQLGALTYPHRLLSVFLGESGSTDDTVKVARSVTLEFKNSYKFNDSGVLLLNLTGGTYGNYKVRHKLDAQLFRRSHIAMARNSLLELVLKKLKFDHVLWIDSDIAELPHDVIEQLLFAKSDVVATPCLQKGGEYKTKYDRNSWQETPESLKEQTLLQTDALVVEGYNKSSRLFLPDLLSEGRIVPLDGVGGCVLMIKADCHRNGLRFPDHVYKHHIETEGLAKLAKDMGYTVVGLPFVEVFHS